MIFLEAGLFAILAVLFLHTSYSDLKSGRIGNKSIIIALGVGLVCAAFYYYFFATDCLLAYSINVGLAIVISIVLYLLGMWGAGDCKLLVTTVILLPARIYCLNDRSLASCFLLIAIIFIIAYIYVVFETLYLGIKQKDLLKCSKLTINWKSYIKGFLFFFLLLSLASTVIVNVLPDSVLADSILLTSIHFVLILIGLRFEEKANWNIVLIMGLAWAVSIIAGFSSFSLSGVNWISYIIVIILLVFRLIADRYNYKTIEITNLKPGMILSFGSVIAFSQSKINGLPKFTSEDLRSRITVEEVDSINRWSKTKNGQETITIVRKIPFALFIAIGTVLFVVLEVLAA